MRKQINWVRDRWILLAGSLAIALLLTLVLGFRIGALTHGVSVAEVSYIQGTDSGKEIAQNPSYLAHKLPTYIFGKLGVNRVGAYRAISASLTAVAAFSIYYILKRWYSLRVAVLGSWLFVTSAWGLHIGRLASPEAVFLLPLPFIAAVVWMTHTNKHRLGIFVLCALIVASLYIPGAAWLTLALLIWQRRALWQLVKEQPGLVQAFCSIILMAGMLPLLLAGFVAPDNFLIAAGLPADLPSVKQVTNNAIHIPLQLFMRGPDDPSRWLGQLPLLDVFSTVMLLLGIYSLRYHLSGIRTRIIGAYGLLFGVLIIIGGVPIASLVPVVYILIGAGIAFMLQQWFTVFPRNPIARAIATTLMSVAVLLVSFHHISHYFIAWPQTPATKRVFSQSLVK